MSHTLRNFIFLFSVLIKSIAFAQPVISSFAPFSAAPGSNITISGTNFSASAAANIVYFGAVKAIVGTASATQLSVTVPLGALYQPLSVTVNGLTGYSTRAFLPTFAGNSNPFNSGSFASPVDSSTGTSPYAVALSDFDGDGKVDMCAPNYTGSSVSVLRNTSAPGITSFGYKIDFAVGTQPSSIAAGDLNGDGKPDIIITNYTSSSTIAVLLNTSTGIGIISFAPLVNFTSNTYPSSVAINDIDGDGRTDIVVGCPFLPGFCVLRNTGSGTVLSFAPKVDFIANTASNTVCISDIDGDNKPDVLISNSGPDNFSSFRNTSIPGTISFAPKIDVATGGGPNAMLTGDLDADGKTDVVVSNANDGTISIFRNTSAPGSITYAPKIDSVAGEAFSYESITIGDLNGDGKPDLAIATYDNAKLTVYNNTCTPGNIAFSNKVIYNVAIRPKGIAAGDLDGDGKPDLIIAANTAKKLSVLRTTSPLKVNSVSPLVAPVGSTVTITGSDFRSQPAENIVFFGAVRATVTSASYNSLTVTVPVSATYSPISVTADHHTAYSQEAFSPSFTGGDPIIANSFAAKKNILNAGADKIATVADFDGDGKIDFAAQWAIDSINVFRNISTSGDVSFDGAYRILTTSDPQFLTCGDLNADGRPEIIVTHLAMIQVYQNNSTPGILAFGSSPSPYYPLSNYESYHTFVQDFDDDGRPDIIVEHRTNVTILPNTSANGVISFAAFKQIMLLQSDDKIEVGDMDSDGKVDIIAGNYFLRNTSTPGNISFDVPQSYTSSPLQASFITVADFSGDGKPDLVRGYRDSTKVYYYLNNSTPGNLSFTAQGSNITGTAPTSASVTDLNGDGKPDLAVTCLMYDAVSLFANESTADNVSFIPKVDYSTNTLPTVTLIADLDGDNRPDLLSTSDNNLYTVHRYEIASPSTTIPLITSINPSSGPIGSTVVITGKNFTPNISGNIVQFGTVNAVVSAATTNSLTVIVPAGATYQPVSVTNAGGLIAFSHQQFNITFPGAGPVLSEQSFDTAKTFLTGDNPTAVAIGDLNGDGKNDIVVVNEDANTVSVFRNTSVPGTLSLAAKVDYPVSNFPSHCMIGDLDGDGKPELVVTSSSGLFNIFKNTSSGNAISFDQPVNFIGNPIGITHAYMSDLDLDGKSDLVIWRISDSVNIFRNTTVGGTISFAAPVAYVSDYNGGQSISVKDFDGDGKPDLAYMGGPYMYVFNNTSNVGDISFTSASKHRIFPNISAGGFIAAADFNNDGDYDALDLLGPNATIGVVENKSIRGTHLFETGSILGTQQVYTYSFTADDMDGDGKADIVTGSPISFPALAVFKNMSDINSLQFLDPVNFAIPFSVSASPITFATGDIDGDGRPDIVTSHELRDSISILRNKIGDPIRLCADGNTSFTTTITATNYQWQLNSDSTTFNNISNNGNYSGANTATLQLTNMPSSATGNQYRCVTNNGTSEVFSIRFYNHWTGAINSQWENPGNWSCGTVPDNFTDVIIQAPATVVLNSNTTIATLLLDPGVNMTITTGHTLTLAGH